MLNNIGLTGLVLVLLIVVLPVWLIIRASNRKAKASTYAQQEEAMIAKLFNDHPASVDETYLQHAAFAGRFSLALFGAAFAALVHAVFPFLFEKTASRTVARLYQWTHNRGS